MTINGRSLKEVWKSIDPVTKKSVCEVVGRTYIKGNREFLPKDIYESLDDDQKKYVNLMCNRILKLATSPWNVTCVDGYPKNEGQYWCIIIYRVPADGFKPHAVIDTRFYGDIDNSGRCEFNPQTGSYVGEEVYAWLDTPVHNTMLPILPYGVSIE